MERPQLYPIRGPLGRRPALFPLMVRSCALSSFGYRGHVEPCHYPAQAAPLVFYPSTACSRINLLPALLQKFFHLLLDRLPLLLRQRGFRRPLIAKERLRVADRDDESEIPLLVDQQA